jgi:predicted ATPase
MAMLKRVILKGFKSIREMNLELRSLKIMIGANGAGKSNLISFFKMVGEMAGGRLQNYVAAAGRAHSLPFYGPRVTTQIWAQLDFETLPGLAWYFFVLSHAAGDALYFADETARDTTTLNYRLGEVWEKNVIGGGPH